MEDKNIPVEEKANAVPRPAWQRVLALGAVIVLVIGFVLYCLQIAGGGI